MHWITNSQNAANDKENYKKNQKKNPYLTCQDGKYVHKTLHQLS